MKAIAIIEDEHRAITAVIEGLRHVVAEIVAGRMAPDHELLGALFHYIGEFPERLHHPKEDEYLFARLRERRPDAEPMLAGLEREHAIGCERFRDDSTKLSDFADRVERYAHFHWLHMRKEEDDVLPLARAALTAEDWR